MTNISGINQLKRIAVLISGSGTNLQAILDAVTADQLRAKVVLVVSNRKAAFGLVRAEQAGIPTLYFPLKPYNDAGKSREQYDADLADRIYAYQPDLLVLAGWMHVLSTVFLNRFAGKVINLHPALPDAYPGIDAIERAFVAYQNGQIKYSGCMIHYVVPEVDAGSVIVQTIVPFERDDTLESFAKRMHAAEHRIIVEAIKRVLEMKN